MLVSLSCTLVSASGFICSPGGAFLRGPPARTLHDTSFPAQPVILPRTYISTRPLMVCTSSVPKRATLL